MTEEGPVQPESSAPDQESVAGSIHEIAAGLRAWREGEEIGAQAGISDPLLIARLTRLGSATVRILPLLPLVRVAWADDRVDETERDWILALARRQGVVPQGDAYEHLSKLLRQPPDEELLDLAEDVLASKAGRLLRDQSLALKHDVVRQCRELAKVSRGFMGLGRTARANRAAIANLEARLCITEVDRSG